MADAIGKAMGSSQIPPQKTVLDRAQEFSAILHETGQADATSDKVEQQNLSQKMFDVLAKDWDRFSQRCNGSAPPPLPVKEAEADLLTFVQYMTTPGHGDQVKIGSTGAKMNEVVASCIGAARKVSGDNPDSFSMNLAYFIASNDKIPNDYCFLRQPAEEYIHSVMDAVYTKMSDTVSGNKLATPAENEAVGKILNKDWSRLTQEFEGKTPQPLPPPEAEDDFVTYVQYMQKYGDGIKIGSTNTTMGEIMRSNIEAAKANMNQQLQLLKQATGKDPDNMQKQFIFSTNLAQLIAFDKRIPSDYCFLQSPAKEYATSLAAMLQQGAQQ